MTSITPFTSVAAPARPYTQEQWEEQRNVITRVYRDEAKSLEELRVVLAQTQSFYPTEAALKKKIRLWDLGRNLREADMRHALSLFYDRDAIGKKTVFLVRNRIVTFAEVERYFRRKGIKDLRGLTRGSQTATPTTNISCRTPEPGVRDINQDPSGSNVQEDIVEILDVASITALPNPEQPEVDRSLRLPASFHQLGKLLLLGRGYYDSIFDGPAWRLNNFLFEVDKLETFFHHFADGQSLLTGLVDQRCIAEAFGHFHLGFDMIRGILTNGTLLFLPYICYLLLPLGLRRHEVISQLLRFTARMARNFAPQRHPLAQSLAALSELPSHHWPECSSRLLRSLVDRLWVEFREDVPPIHELDSIGLCPDPGRPQSNKAVNSYAMASVAVAKLARDVDAASGKYDHSMYGAHGDIKPENILYFSAPGDLKIVDMGLVRYHSDTFGGGERNTEEVAKCQG